MTATDTTLVGPKEISIQWECMELEERGLSDVTFSCSSGSEFGSGNEFRQGYWNGTVDYEVNDQN